VFQQHGDVASSNAAYPKKQSTCSFGGPHVQKRISTWHCNLVPFFQQHWKFYPPLMLHPSTSNNQPVALLTSSTPHPKKHQPAALLFFWLCIPAACPCCLLQQPRPPSKKQKQNQSTCVIAGSLMPCPGKKPKNNEYVALVVLRCCWPPLTPHPKKRN